MNIEHMVQMANDIAAFFDGESPGTAAADAVATHLTRYWVPVMRKQIVAHIEQGPGGLAPTAYAAIQKLAREQQANAAKSA